MKRKIITIFLALLATSAMARQATNVRVMQNGTDIVITYDLDEVSTIKIKVIYGDDSIQRSYQYRDYWGSYITSYRMDAKTEYLNNDELEGDIGFVRAGKDKRVVWHVLQNRKEFVYNNVSFAIETKRAYDFTKTFLLAEYGYGFAPQHSWGLMFGQNYYLFGWYLSGRTNFSWAKDWQWTKGNGYTCDAAGYIGEELPFYSGRTKTNHFMVSVGMLWEMLETFCYHGESERSMLALYLGATYGQRYQLWQTADNQWITYGPTAYKGFGGEVGIIADIYGFTLMVGVSTIEFKYMEITTGIGFAIPHKW